MTFDNWSMKYPGGDLLFFMDQQDSALHRHIKAMPKAELHVHLEGSIKFETVFELADTNGVKLPFASPERLRERCDFKGFDEFARIYLAIVSCLGRPEDMSRAAFELGKRMHADGTVYAEVTWTPQLHVTEAYPFEAWLDAVNDGRRRAERQFGVVIRWIIDICRDRYHTQADVVSWATSRAAIDGGVIALGLGGTETHYPPHYFMRSFEAARKAGLRSVPHAGEHKGKYAGPSSVWGAIEWLGADRIGHGNRAVEDTMLMEHLSKHKTPLELSPTSNIKFGLYKDLTEHPIKQLVDAGCYVTINTDDPEIFATTLTDELYNVAVALELSADEVAHIVQNAFLAAFDKEAAHQALKNARRADQIAGAVSAAAHGERRRSSWAAADQVVI